MVNRSGAPRLDELLQDYATLQAQYATFGDRLHALIDTLLTGAEIRIHAIEHRTKSTPSLREKVSRPGKHYDALRDVLDLCGLRIIVYYPEDVARITELIRAEFAVDLLSSSDAGSHLAPHEFGYRSVHVVIQLSAQRAELREWRSFSEFRAEIQIRTVLQHAWAAISHALQYKHEDAVPRDLRRRLYRLAGLLELADEEFSTLSRLHGALADELAAATGPEVAALAIDQTSLAEWVHRTKLVHAFTQMAKDLHIATDDFRLHNSAAGGRDSEDDLHAISGLAAECALAGIRTIQDLEDGLAKAAPSLPQSLEALHSKHEGWIMPPLFLIRLAVIFWRSDRFTPEQLEAVGWDRELAEQVLGAAKRSVARPSD